MNGTKEKKARLQVIFAAIILTIIMFAELYLMINQYENYALIVILGVVAVVAVYIMVNAMMTMSAEKEAQRQTHFDNIYKSEKASYIMLKTRFEEIERKLALIQEISKIPSEEIINAQKGIAKVIINRSKENADAIINSNDQVLERLDEMDETQNTKFTGISKDQRLKLTEMSNQTEMKLQDMLVQLKDMELRLNQAIMQSGGKAVVTATPQYTEDIFAAEPLMMEDDLGVEDIEASVEEELLVDEVLAEEPIAEAPILEEAPIVEESVAEEPVVEEPVVVAPEIDLSDPNKAMSPDDIAALFASMTGGDATEEPVEEEIVEPEVEDIPPMPDLSDPNRAMTPDEIAALIANL